MINLSKWFQSPRRRREEKSNRVWLQQYSRTVQAKYDAAQTSIENERYWAAADGKSARAALDRDIRRKICQRARYEASESGAFANGIVTAKVNDIVGRGASVRVQTENKEFNEAAEAGWNAWCKATRFHAKARTMCGAYIRDGEAFAERISNPKLALRHPVLMDVRLSECDLWTDPYGIDGPNLEDGITYDESGEPLSYKRLKQHPGDDFLGFNALETEPVPSENVIHWFRADRPDQRRGVSHLAPALPLFADLRRYRLATVAAAEVAANFSAVMYSEANAFQEDPDEVDENFLTINLERRSMLTLPAGWKMSQLKAEQPSTSFSSFTDSILQECGRVTQTPLNIISGTSKDYSFASGRLDYLLYWNQNDTDRADCDNVVYDRVFGWWLDEALLVPGYLPNLGEEVEVPRTFIFPPRQPIDIEAQANADEIYFNLGLLTDADWSQRQAKDLDQHYEELSDMGTRRQAMGVQMPAAEEVKPDANQGTKAKSKSVSRQGATVRRRGSGGANSSGNGRRDTTV